MTRRATQFAAVLLLTLLFAPVNNGFIAPIPQGIAQTITQTPHIQICSLPCTIPLQPELAAPTPGTNQRIELNATPCEFEPFDLRTRSAACTSTITVMTNTAFRLHWTLKPVTHVTVAHHQLATRYRIEATAGDMAPIDLTLEPKALTRNTVTPVWLPGATGPVATYRLTATATIPPPQPLPRAGTYQAHIQLFIESTPAGS